MVQVDSLAVQVKSPALGISAGPEGKNKGATRAPQCHCNSDFQLLASGPFPEFVGEPHIECDHERQDRAADRFNALPGLPALLPRAHGNADQEQRSYGDQHVKRTEPSPPDAAYCAI